MTLQNNFHSTISSSLGDFKKSGVCSDLLDALTTFLAHHKYIVLLCNHVTYIEQSLYEPLPKGVEENEINLLEIKSAKSVMLLRPLTCHIPVSPGLVARRAR